MQISTTMQMHNSSAKVQPRSLVRRLVAVRTQLSAALDQLCLQEQTIQQAAALLTDTLSLGVASSSAETEAAQQRHNILQRNWLDDLSKSARRTPSFP